MKILKNIVNYFEELIASVYVRVQVQKGQGALEYIAIVAGLILVIAIGFAVAGEDVRDEAKCFVHDIVKDTPCPYRTS